VEQQASKLVQKLPFDDWARCLFGHIRQIGPVLVVVNRHMKRNRIVEATASSAMNGSPSGAAFSSSTSQAPGFPIPIVVQGCRFQPFRNVSFAWGTTLRQVWRKHGCDNTSAASLSRMPAQWSRRHGRQGHKASDLPLRHESFSKPPPGLLRPPALAASGRNIPGVKVVAPADMHAHHRHRTRYYGHAKQRVRVLPLTLYIPHSGKGLKQVYSK